MFNLVSIAYLIQSSFVQQDKCNVLEISEITWECILVTGTIQRNKMLLSGYWHKYWRAWETHLIRYVLYQTIFKYFSFSRPIQYCSLSLAQYLKSNISEDMFMQTKDIFKWETKYCFPKNLVVQHVFYIWMFKHWCFADIHNKTLPHRYVLLPCIISYAF